LYAAEKPVSTAAPPTANTMPSSPRIRPVSPNGTIAASAVVPIAAGSTPRGRKISAEITINPAASRAPRP
jgi:hypothetical protein